MNTGTVPRTCPPRTIAIIPAIVLLVLLVPWLPSAATAQDIISEVAIIYGSNSSIQAPAGYTKVNTDLNLQAGGDYMYLCYKRGTGAPISGIAVTRGGGVPPAGPAWTKINIDLNRHAGGDYIYLWYTKDPSCAVIYDIIVLNGRSTATPPGYTKINTDLNENAGGAYLYFAYLKH